MKATEVAAKIGVDERNVSKSKGTFTLRQSFFYTHGCTSDRWVAKVSAAFPNATILDHGEIWKPFKGGAPLTRQSHWFVKFTLPEVVEGTK